MAKLAAHLGAKAYDACLDRFESRFLQEEALGRVVFKGAAIAADEIRREIDALPAETFRYLQPGDKFTGVPEAERRDLKEHFGLAPLKHDRDGFFHTKAGFSGYGWRKTKTWPQGVPVALTARSIASGTSWRTKNPFINRAVRKAMQPAIAAMQKALDEELEKIFFNN